MSTSPLCTATCSGTAPCASLASAGALCASSSSMMSGCRLWAAMCSGVPSVCAQCNAYHSVPEQPVKGVPPFQSSEAMAVTPCRVMLHVCRLHDRQSPAFEVM